MVGKRQVMSEKATLMACAITAISWGIQKIAENDILVGSILFLIGIILVIIREKFKFCRWSKI